MNQEKTSQKPLHDGDAAENALDMVTSTVYGLSPSFIKKHDSIIESTKKVLSDRMAADRSALVRGTVDSEKTSSAAEYAKIIAKSIIPSDKDLLMRSLKHSDKYGQPSGSHSINSESISNTDESIDILSDGTAIEELMSELQNHFALMPEYNKIIDIIPELGKAVEMIVRDIVNSDEFTQKYITNFYEESNVEVKKDVEIKIKELLDEYDFEGKIRRWIFKAEVVGVKPFSILPQDDVVSLINTEIKKRKAQGFSTESDNLIPRDIKSLFSEESFLQKSLLDPIYETYKKISTNTISIESSDELERTKRSVNDILNPFMESIITDDITQEWESICLEEFEYAVKDLRIDNINDDSKQKKISEEYDNFMKNYNSKENLILKNSRLRDQFKDLVVSLERCIEIVDPLKGPLYQGLSNVNNNHYTSNGYSEESGSIEDFYKIGRKDKSKKPAKIINIGGFEIDISENPINSDEYAKVVKNKRAILTDYEPEHVIPISVGSTHVGYYVVEYLRTSGDNFMMLKKDRGSFADIVRRIGLGEDGALIKNTGTTASDSNNPFSSGVFAPSTIMAPIVSGGPSTPFSKIGRDGKSSRKNELLKAIIIKMIAKKIGDDKLINNGTFQSSVMNLVRDDLIWKNNVRFTFIPESHMVYMSRELNADGLPLSAFNGTLFTCYSYIASMISSLLMKVMKSSDVETMEVNVGKSKELGLSIGSISKNASTRNVSAKTLFSGTDQIVRGVGNYKRLIIPVIDGEKLFDVTQVEKANDVTIDDEYTTNLLKSVILRLGTPPTSLDMLSQDEYVASQTQHRLDYRNLIVDRGVNYSKFITKAIRLLITYSDISIPSLKIDKEGKHIHEEVGDEKKDLQDVKIDLQKINFKFVPPKALTVTKITEEINTIFELADNIVKMYYGDVERSSS